MRCQLYVNFPVVNICYTSGDAHTPAMSRACAHILRCAGAADEEGGEPGAAAGRGASEGDGGGEAPAAARGEPGAAGRAQQDAHQGDVRHPAGGKVAVSPPRMRACHVRCFW